MKDHAQTGGEFTGRHMLAIMLAFFGVIIAVNVGMAMLAGSSWTGFVVANSYVASQEFNGKLAAARAQTGLGWTASLEISAGRALLLLADRQGRPIHIEAARLNFRSPATDREDLSVALAPGPDETLRGAVAIRDGAWIVEIVAEKAGETPWRETRRIVVGEGVAK